MDPNQQSQSQNTQETSIKNDLNGGNAPSSSPTPTDQTAQTSPQAVNQPQRKPNQQTFDSGVPNQVSQGNPINPRVVSNSSQSAQGRSVEQVPGPKKNTQSVSNAPNKINREAAVLNYAKNNSGAKTLFFAVLVGVIFTALAGAGVFFFLNNSGQNELASNTNISGSATSPSQGEELPPLPVVERDSILRSTDSGQTFATYFRIETEEQIGLVDVLTISFHPENSGEVTVSTYSDGLFISENTGDTWEQVPFEPKRIYSFVLDQANPDNRAFASGIVSENGRIFRTEDKGQSWRAVYAEPGDRTFVSALSQDPRNPNIILAGTNKGTFIRSFDGGDTWENIGQSINGSIDDFTHDSTKQSFAYLLARGDVYHSDDAGKTWKNWEEIKEQEIDDLTDRARELRRDGNRDAADAINDRIDALKEKNREQALPSGIIEIQADPNNTGVLYAGLRKGLYRSTDFGKYWLPVNIIESAERFPIPSIAIHPDDSDEISFVAGDSFYRSINYGQTWAVTPLDKSRNASFVTYDPFDPTIIYIGLSQEN